MDKAIVQVKIQPDDDENSVWETQIITLSSADVREGETVHWPVYNNKRAFHIWAVFEGEIIIPQ